MGSLEHCKRDIFPGNTVFSIQKPDKDFLFVEKGSLDIFFVKTPKTGYGAREFIVRIGENCMIPPFSPNYDFDIIACTIGPTEIITIKEIDFIDITKSDPPKYIDSIDQTIRTILIAFFNSTDKQGHTSTNYFPGSVTLNNDIFSPSNKMVWVEFVKGSALIQKNDDYKLQVNDIFPVTTQTWLYFEDDTEANIFTSHTLLENGHLLDFLLKFSIRIFAFSVIRHKKNEVKARQHILSLKETKKEVKSTAFEKLFSLFSSEKSQFHVSGSGDILFDTLQLIGQSERISFSLPIEKSLGLTSILKYSNIKSRKIALKGDWWKNSSDAMLSFLDEDKSPVALIPYKNLFKLINLATGLEVVVDANVDNTLEPFAYSFYTPLPAKDIIGKDLWKFALPFVKKDIAFFFIVGISAALLALLIPIITGYIFSDIVPGVEKSLLLQITIILIAITVINAILGFVQSIAMLRIEGKSSYRLQAAIWDRILSIETRFFKDFTSGELAERSMAIESMRQLLTGVVTNSIISGMFSLFYLIMMFYYSPMLAFLSLILGIIAISVTITSNIIVSKYVANTQKLDAIISGFLLQIINGIQKIRTTDTQEKVFEIFSHKFAEKKSNYLKQLKIGAIIKTFLAVFPTLASIVIFLEVYKIIVLDHATGFSIANYLAFNSAYGFFLGGLIQMSMATLAILNIKPLYNLIKPILTAKLEISEDKNDPGEINGNIDIQKVNFRYNPEGELILKDISLTVKAGEFVAIVGTSGSGKSTIIRLLLGFEKHESGSIFVDDMDLSTLEIKAFRRQIGVVLQNSKIMQGTILNNIIGSSNLTIDDAWGASKMAGCEDDIRAMPMQMHTILPPGGGTLSGGQQQRIIIARALAHKPKILIFDEATSALDNKTQKIVSDSIDKLNVTRIVIAHRLSTIINADNIYVMDKGKIIENGTYGELMKNNGFFAELSKRQIA